MRDLTHDADERKRKFYPLCIESLKGETESVSQQNTPRSFNCVGC